jgi:hypothetical protein
MNNNYFIHPNYLGSQKIRECIEELIIDYRYKSYSQLTLSDKYKLSTIISKESGINDETNFFTERDSGYLMNLFRRYVLTQKDIDKDYFMQEMKNSLIDYYDETMRQLFDYYSQEFIEAA